MEPVPDVPAAQTVSGSTSSDPAVGLRAVVALRQLVERLEDLQVENARNRGWSWAEIAAALGVSKQAVHKKHSGHTPTEEKR
jgi:ribosome-binding protein aMBF1 (putative translation factor)